MQKRLIANFHAEDHDIALKFVEKLNFSTSHNFELDEVTTDNFELFFVAHDKADMDGDYEEALQMLTALFPDELKLDGIHAFYVVEGAKYERV